MSPSPLVTLHLWGVPRRHIPSAIARMATDRGPVRRAPGLQFAKLLGTGNGTTFRARDADLRHWGLLTVWHDPTCADDFAAGTTMGGWDRISEERLAVHLRPLASRGRWSGQAPFGDPAPRPHSGPVASITRARLAPAKARSFYRAVPPVSADLARSPGLRLALAVGEAPIGLQGTFSIWESSQSLNNFAARRPAHSEVVGRTTTEGWYSEELFARFAVLDVTGTYGGVTP